MRVTRRESVESPAAVFCCLGCRLAASMTDGKGGTLPFLEARLLLSAFLAMGVMTFSLVLYGESVYDAEKDAAMGLVRGIARGMLIVFSVPVFLLLGLPMIRGAWIDLKQGRVRMDGLIVLATVAAFALSIHHTLQGTGEVYFETATMVLVLVTFGRRLEARAKASGSDAAETVAELLPDVAHREGEGGALEDAGPESLAPGDVVHVLPGEAVPAELVVLEGTSEITAAHITGELAPRAISAGSRVPAGAVNGTGSLRARVRATAGEGSLGRIRRLLESPLGDTDALRLTDRVAGWLAVVAAILATAGVWTGTLRGGIGEGLQTGLAVLLVACPCALGLATPLAYRAIRTRLARRGILVRDVVALERAAEADCALLDKTGTLTESSGALEPVEGSPPGTMERLAALVGRSNHPLARAVPAAATAILEQVEVIPGRGVMGVVEGRPCRAGSPRWMDEAGFTWNEGLAERRDALAREGATLVAVAEGERVSGLAALSQGLRPEAEDAVRRLESLGLVCEIASGDEAAAVAAVGTPLGVSARGRLQPEDKLERVEQLAAEGRTVLMAGDGLNDAPALRRAAVGVAMGTGAAATRSLADVEILRDDLRALPELVEAGRRLGRVVRGNIGWTLAYNTIALVLAVTGRLHPLAAAVLMIVSSLVVAHRSYGLLEEDEA